MKKTAMKLEYLNPLCESVTVIIENTLLSGSPKTLKGEGYGNSEDDDENWG